MTSVKAVQRETTVYVYRDVRSGEAGEAVPHL